MRLYCDNKTTFHIAELTKTNKVDYHLVRQKLAHDKIIEIQHVSYISPLARSVDKTSWRALNLEYL